MRITTLLFIFNFLGNSHISAQGEIDSLRQCIKHCPYDSLRLNALLTYAGETDPIEEGIEVLDSSIRSDIWKGDPAARLKMYSLLSQMYYENDQYRKSIEQNKKYLNIAVTLKDTGAIINANNRFNILYYRLSQPDSSLYFLNRNYGLLKGSKDTFSIGANLNGLGLYYIKKEEYKRAFKYFNQLKNLALANRSGMKNSFLGTAFGNLGILYGKWGKPDSAKYYLHKKLEILPGNISAINELGNIARKEENYNEALDYYHKVYDYGQNSGNMQAQAASANNLALVYNLSGKPEKAIKFALEGEIASQQMNRTDWIIISLNEQLNAQKELRNFPEALQLSERLRNLEDSVKSLEVQERMASLESTYQLKEKTTALELSESQNQLQQLEINRISWKNRIAAILIVLVLLIIVLVVIYNRRLNKAKAKLAAANALKDRFFAIVAHDLKGGISGFSGIGPMLEHYINGQNNEAAIKLTREIENEAQRMENMLDHLLKWAFLQLDRINLHMEKTDIQKLIEDRTEELKFPMESKNIKLHLKLEEKYVIGDPDALAFVLRNLLSNAIKFSRPGDQIIIKSRRFNGNTEIDIIDKGVGMTAETLNRLFKPSQKISSTGTAGEKGNGLGLMLSKEFTERINGVLQVKSKLNEGSVFQIILPAA